MMLLLRLKNYFLSISGLKEAAPSNTGWFFNWASPENVSRLAPLCFEKVLSMAAEKGEIPNTLTYLIPRGGQSGTLTFF